jgi:hypothetical protein
VATIFGNFSFIIHLPAVTFFPEGVVLSNKNEKFDTSSKDFLSVLDPR